jgi:hypothetical protein
VKDYAEEAIEERSPFYRLPCERDDGSEEPEPPTWTPQEAFLWTEMKRKWLARKCA